MELLIAYRDDPAGHNMAKFLSKEMTQEDDGVFHGKYYDLVVIPTPAISADWLEEKYDYDGFVFLSKHAADSGVLALTCHSTGNFSDAKFGGNDRQVAIPKPDLQKIYLQTLKDNQPTALTKPSIFIEIGTTEKQWTDVHLCNSVASLVHQVMSQPIKEHPVAICFGGTHYPSKFTDELLEGKYALGTVIPKHALGDLDENLFTHILRQNNMAKTALLDWKGLGPYKQKVLDFLKSTKLEVIKL
jgi:D-aminoacyl-tRNA deacylase